MGERRREDRRPDFLAAVDRGRHSVLSLFQMAMCVLEHDDRRVDDHAYAERKSSERHRVERESSEIEEREGSDHRYRDRSAHDERRTEVAGHGFSIVPYFPFRKEELDTNHRTFQVEQPSSSTGLSILSFSTPLICTHM